MMPFGPRRHDAYPCATENDLVFFLRLVSPSLLLHLSVPGAYSSTWSLALRRLLSIRAFVVLSRQLGHTTKPAAIRFARPASPRINFRSDFRPSFRFSAL